MFFHGHSGEDSKMLRFRTICVAMLASTVSGGCSKPTAQEAPKPDPRPEVFEPVYRVATELRSAQEVGMNRQRFGELLQKLGTELTLARDKSQSAKEHRLIQGYDEVLQIYKDAALIWDLKIKIPELKDLANERVKIEASTGSTDPILRNYQFQLALIKGIPLNFYPEGTTGIDGLVTRYGLPIKDLDGWNTIPNDSVERVWSRARTKTEEVVKSQRD
jgi:hypothetical protein